MLKDKFVLGIDKYLLEEDISQTKVILLLRDCLSQDSSIVICNTKSINRSTMVNFDEVNYKGRSDKRTNNNLGHKKSYGKSSQNRPGTSFKNSSINSQLKEKCEVFARKNHKAKFLCREYSKLIYTRIKDPVLISSDTYINVMDCVVVKTLIVGGTVAKPKEFPHMALLGYSEKVEHNRWACGGSLVSDKWILTAAHCEKIGPSTYARWARLGDLNYLNDTDLAKPKDYKIVQRVIHPKYRSPSLYYDIALFRLEKKVEFSAFVRPICLNADQSLRPSVLEATGWGQIQFGGPFSPDLLKVTLYNIPVKSCNASYSGSVGNQLSNGIVDDSMMCAGYPEGGKDTCGGDSGGPIQIVNPNYTCMYTQIGITSFGQFCAEKNTPGVYTRVSKYISWIEPIVWPKT